MRFVWACGGDVLPRVAGDSCGLWTGVDAVEWL